MLAVCACGADEDQLLRRVLFFPDSVAILFELSTPVRPHRVSEEGEIVCAAMESIAPTIASAADRLDVRIAAAGHHVRTQPLELPIVGEAI